MKTCIKIILLMFTLGGMTVANAGGHFGGHTKHGFVGKGAWPSKDELYQAWADVGSLWPSSKESAIGLDINSEDYDPISDFEVELPHTSYYEISDMESNLLRIYLENPNNKSVTKLLAWYNLKRGGLHFGKMNGESLKRTVLALYFLQRLNLQEPDLRWVRKNVFHIEKKLSYFSRGKGYVSLEEKRRSHLYFIDAFNYNEQNRYKAADKLLRDYLRSPNNVFTSFYLMASHSWLAGEERYNDPLVLNQMVIASYFSLRARDLAKKAEELWFENDLKYERFRMSNIVGGLSMISRQWIAALHGDPTVVEALNNEHREWRLVQKPFHAFTAGYAFFENWETFGEGMAAWEDAFNECVANPDQRTCLARPRFSFNPIPMVTGFTDFLMKAGVAEAAEGLLYQVTFQEGFDLWDLGQDAWSHRLNNLELIIERYQNADVSDDPLPLMMSKSKWGRNLPTCQICHQAQSKQWTVEEREEILLPLEIYATVGNWPELATTWFGELQE